MKIGDIVLDSGWIFEVTEYIEEYHCFYGVTLLSYYDRHRLPFCKLSLKEHFPSIFKKYY